MKRAIKCYQDGSQPLKNEKLHINDLQALHINSSRRGGEEDNLGVEQKTKQQMWLVDT